MRTTTPACLTLTRIVQVSPARYPFRVILWGKITVSAALCFAQQCSLHIAALYFSHLYNWNGSIGDPDLYQFVSQLKVVTRDSLKRIHNAYLKFAFIFSDYA